MPGYGPDNTPLRRFNLKHLRNDILRALNLEKGILYTLLYLTIQPGKVLKTYLFEDRSKVVKPLPFLLLMVTIATFLTINYLDLAEMMRESGGAWQDIDDPRVQESMDTFYNFFSQSYNIVQLMSVPFLALSSYVVFNEHRYHFAEHLVIAAFLTAMINAFYIITFPFSVQNYFLMSLILIVVSLIYFTIVYTQVFGEPVGISILKSIGLQTLYFFSIMMVMTIVAFVYGVYMSYHAHAQGG